MEQNGIINKRNYKCYVYMPGARSGIFVMKNTIMDKQRTKYCLVCIPFCHHIHFCEWLYKKKCVWVCYDKKSISFYDHTLTIFISFSLLAFIFPCHYFLIPRFTLSLIISHQLQLLRFYLQTTFTERVCFAILSGIIFINGFIVGQRLSRFSSAC